jgi:hypothetical protein
MSLGRNGRSHAGIWPDLVIGSGWGWHRVFGAASAGARMGCVSSPTLSNFPPVVYAPNVTASGDDQVRLEMHHTADRQVAIFVYSALDRLEQMYGPSTPWVLLTVEDLQAAYEQAPYDLLFLDQRIGRGRSG